MLNGSLYSRVTLHNLTGVGRYLREWPELKDHDARNFQLTAASTYQAVLHNNDRLSWRYVALESIKESLHPISPFFVRLFGDNSPRSRACLIIDFWLLSMWNACSYPSVICDHVKWIRGLKRPLNCLFSERLQGRIAHMFRDAAIVGEVHPPFFGIWICSLSKVINMLNDRGPNRYRY